jgi:hypothetical protein
LIPWRGLWRAVTHHPRSTLTAAALVLVVRAVIVERVMTHNYKMDLRLSSGAMFELAPAETPGALMIAPLADAGHQ